LPELLVLAQGGDSSHPHLYPHRWQNMAICSPSSKIAPEMMSEDAKFALGF
jgi:hypothetical protein